jgi:hypothetical protein
MMDEIAAQTRLFRESPDPMWAKLRELVRDRSADPQSTVLAFSVEDGDEHEFGVVVTAERRVFEYAFAVDGARFDEWTEITGRHWGTPYGQAVETALASL